MFRVVDTITGDVLEYEDVEDFRDTAKEAFDEGVHDAIDGIADAYNTIRMFEGMLHIEVL